MTDTLVEGHVDDTPFVNGRDIISLSGEVGIGANFVELKGTDGTEWDEDVTVRPAKISSTRGAPPVEQVLLNALTSNRSSNVSLVLARLDVSLLLVS